MKAGPLLVLKRFCLVTLAVVPWQTFRQDMDHASIIKAQMQRARSQAGMRLHRLICAPLPNQFVDQLSFHLCLHDHALSKFIVLR